jgi:hypothetical protein
MLDGISVKRGYFGYYRATAYAMKHSLMPEIAKLRMKALNFLG